MKNKLYKHVVTLRALQDEKYTFIQSESDLKEFLEMIGLPKKYRSDITGMVLVIGDGDIDAVWLSESGAYYALSAHYYALPYYRPVSWTKSKLPVYWLESNAEYNL